MKNNSTEELRLLCEISIIKQRIKALSARQGITLVALSVKIGYTNCGLHRALSHGSLPVYELYKIASVLQCDVSDFFKPVNI